MRRQPDLDPIANRRSQTRIRLNPGRDHDIGLDDFGAHGIGFAHNRGQRHGGMAGQAILDLARSDPVTGRRDHIVVAAEK